MYNLNNGIDESTIGGGIIRYHRAEWDPDGKRNPDCEWLVWFTDDPTRFRGFTAAEGEAMGLTPPPAPLVVTCNGHRVELSDEEAEWYATDWEGTVDRSPHGSCATKLARLLRDARQDPQPTADSEPWPWGDEGFMCPKMVRETLCVAQAYPFEAVATMTWACEECGWEWPYRGEEAWAWAECDSCGGRLVEQDAERAARVSAETEARQLRAVAEPICGNEIVTREHEGTAAEIVMCQRRNGPCPYRKADGSLGGLRSVGGCAVTEGAEDR